MCGVITQAEFMQQYNSAPKGVEEIAEIAATISDNDSLARAAQKATESLDRFMDELQKIGFDFG